MASQNGTDWHLIGEEIGSCNCDWGCGCQFDALPTHDNCEAFAGWQISEGHFGDTNLDGVKFAIVYWWPGPVHEGMGHAQLIVDEGATPDQRAALIELVSADHGGGYFEVFAAVAPHRSDPMFAPISIEINREARVAHLQIPGLVETTIQPIKHRMTGEEHRVQIGLPDGFEYKLAEIGNTVSFKSMLDGPLAFENENSYAQLNPIDWTGTETL